MSNFREEFGDGRWQFAMLGMEPQHFYRVHTHLQDRLYFT
tara:strand:- start:318 stop:437 length:120 start_codon:yes stop_codon:yes gene_type:complete